MRLPRIVLSPVLVTIVAVATVIAFAASGVALPESGLLLVLTVAYSSYRGGLVTGMIATALCVAALLTESSFTGIGFSTTLALRHGAYTLTFVVLAYVIGTLRFRAREASSGYSGLAQRQALVAQEHMAQVLESISDGFLTLETNWRIAYVNARAEQMLGRKRSQLLGRSWLEAFPATAGTTFHRELERARRQRSPIDFEAVYGPESLWLEVRVRPLLDGSLTVYFRDVTRRKRAQESIALHARMLDAVGQSVIAADASAQIFFWNRAAQELFGWRAEEVIGKSSLAILHASRDADGSDQVLAHIAAGQARTGEMALRRRDGSFFPAFVADSPIRDENGRLLGVVRVASDLSKRRADEQAQHFLAEAGAALASTLNYESTMATLAQLAVPRLGDGCVIEVMEEEARVHRIETAWARQLTGEDVLFSSRRVHDGHDPTALALVSDSEPQLITRITDQVLRALTTDSEEVELLRHGGVRSAIVAPLRTGGRTVGTFTVLSVSREYDAQDLALVSELARRAAFAVDNALLYEAARLANQAKSDFLAVVSHELRTPLTTVMGYTDLLLAGVPNMLTPPSRKYVERIRAAAWHLLGLIEQILIYARLEVGREQLHGERILLHDVLRDAAALIEPVAAEKGLKFTLATETPDSAIETDLTKLKQILLNLLSNAVKFTDEGEVRLEGRIEHNEVEFIVQDTGIGIAPEHQERVFDSFWQVDQSATRSAGGTGLGLSVTRKLSRLLGGDVSVSSAPGAGTTFTVRLPVSLRRGRRDSVAALDSAHRRG